MANESRSLSNELAEMLSALEVEDLRGVAVESAVIGDDEKVQNVLKAMVERINKLERPNKKGLHKYEPTVVSTRRTSLIS